MGRCATERRREGSCRRWLLIVVLTAGMLVIGQARAQDETSTGGSRYQLEFSGQVLLPDGTPAAAATVSSNSQFARLGRTVTSDVEGRFLMRDPFRDDVKLAFRSADGMFQSTWRIPAMSSRRVLKDPANIRLKPARPLRVRVLDAEGPVVDARIVASGLGNLFREFGRADKNGEATLFLPPDCPLDDVTAWHPARGVAARHESDQSPLAAEREILLAPPRQRTIVVVDPSGEPVSETPLALGFRVGDAWAGTAALPEAYVRPDAAGRVIVPWTPRDAIYVEVNADRDVWMIDEMPKITAKTESLMLRLRPKHLVQGRLSLPDGVSGAGILIQGRSFGPANRGDWTTARAAADGTFALPCSADHCYAISVIDEQWASDLRSGVILATDEGKPTTIELPVYAATPVEFQVTRGPHHSPVAGAWIDLKGTERFEWVDSKGQQRRGQLGMGAWVHTDEHGIGRAALGKGAFEAGLRADNWWELRFFNVVGNDAIKVSFHRRWDKARSITGTVSLNGAPHPITRAMSLKLWGTSATIGFGPPPAVAANVLDDGRFTGEVDNEVVTAFAYDPVEGYAGVATVMADKDDLTIELTKNGAIEGTLVDALGKPMAGVELGLTLNTTRQVRLPTSSLQFIRGADITIGSPVTTDEQGRFRFEQVPASVEVQPSVPGLKGWFSGSRTVRLSPGQEQKDLTFTFEKQAD